MGDDLDLTGLSPDDWVRVLDEVRLKATMEIERAVDGAPVSRHCPDPLLAELGDIDELRSCLAPALYWSVRESLIVEGMDEFVTSRVALRSARLVVFREAGYEQVEAAQLLSVSPATVKKDIARVRAVQRSGALADAVSRRLPPVPVAPEDRIP